MRFWQIWLRGWWIRGLKRQTTRQSYKNIVIFQWCNWALFIQNIYWGAQDIYAKYSILVCHPNTWKYPWSPQETSYTPTWSQIIDSPELLGQMSKLPAPPEHPQYVWHRPHEWYASQFHWRRPPPPAIALDTWPPWLSGLRACLTHCNDTPLYQRNYGSNTHDSQEWWIYSIVPERQRSAFLPQHPEQVNQKEPYASYKRYKILLSKHILFCDCVPWLIIPNAWPKVDQASVKH